MSQELTTWGPTSGCVAQWGLDGRQRHLEGMVEAEAAREGLGPLSAKQWAVVQFVLDYHDAYERVPPAVLIGRATGLSPRRLQVAFPAGAAKTALRLAGRTLPRDELSLVAPALGWN